MNTTIAKVIAFELGLLIAILTWMAVTDLPKNPPHHAANSAARTKHAFATVSSVRQANEPRLEPVDYPAEEEPADLEEDEPIRTVETYAEEVGSEPYADSGYGDYAVPAEPRNYIGDYPEPVLYEPDCYTTPFFPSDYYQQPAQIIIVSNSRSSGRRHHLRARPRGGGRPMIAHRRSPHRVASRPRSHQGGLDSQRNVPPRIGAVAPPRAANARVAMAGQRARTQTRR